MKIGRVLILLVFLSLACNFPLTTPSVPQAATPIGVTSPATPTATFIPIHFPSATPTVVSGPSHPEDMFPYVVQAGDTLAALATRFSTSVGDIVDHNPFLGPADQHTTLSPGQTLSIRLKLHPAWEKPTPILPDPLFVNGPAQVSAVSLGRLIKSSNGWLKTYIDRTADRQATGAELVNEIVMNYSISPRLLLAILEYQLHALSDPKPPKTFFLGYQGPNSAGFGSQLSWAANTLNNGYYGWREGTQIQFSRLDGGMIVPNPEDNAGSVALQYYFSRFLSASDYQTAVSSTGLISAYQNNFGQMDWGAMGGASFIPPDLKQPALTLPFQPGIKWVYTGGPHTGWGVGDPRAAVDFAPSANVAGCDPSSEWVVAMANGIVARSENGVVILDLDGDGHTQTGWTIQYLHIFAKTAPAVGTPFKTGEAIGHPSCDGGHANGRHVHISRLYNGEWIPAAGTLPFNLGGWVVSQGEKEYDGTLTRGSQVVRSSIYGEFFSAITAEP